MEETKRTSNLPAGISRSQGQSRIWYKMGLLFLMFVLQKIFLCFTWTLVPIMLRTQGASLGAIGMTALIYSPWALKFLYASRIDRHYSPSMGRRKTWIVPLLFLFLAMQLGLSLIRPETHMALLLAAIFVLNTISATMDIAMDGYATDILRPGERPWGNTVQTMGYMAGYMLGAGVFLIVYQHQGWRVTLWIMAALQLALMLPVLLHREMPRITMAPAANRDTAPQLPSTRAFLSRPEVRWFVVFILMVVFLDQGAGQLRLPMLVDKGYDPAALGRLILWYGSVSSVLGAAAGAALFRRAGVRRLFFLICLGASGLCLYSAFIYRIPAPSLLQVGCLLGADKFLSGIVTVTLYSMIMGLSAGPQSATNNAVLNSVIHLSILGIAPVTGRLCDWTGFYPIYLGMALAGIAVFPVGNILLKKRLSISTPEPETQLPNTRRTQK